MKRLAICIGLVLSLPAIAAAVPREQRIPLRQGTLRIHDLNAALCSELHLPSCPAGGEVCLDSPAGSEFLVAVNACLWSGSQLTLLDDSTAVLRFEGKRVDSTCEAIRLLSRVYAAEKAPHATAAQARNWGLLLPEHLDPGRPLVVLVHGLDSDRSDCVPMGDLLTQAGHQVAFFSYPGDQAISDSASLLRRQLRSLQSKFPQIRIDIVAHSMGGLVARDYLEGPDYAGGVDRLIMVAPPNAGSGWARLRTLLSIQENYSLRRYQPEWNWTWLVTEGLGEAGTDLLPGSDFLKQLNSRPRRSGVQYTIIAGNKSSVDRVQGKLAESASQCIPSFSRNWWGVRSCYSKLQSAADRCATETGDSDGPVSLSATRLAGVSDYVVVPADHVSLYMPVGGNPPAAWAVVRDRLAK